MAKVTITLTLEEAEEARILIKEMTDLLEHNLQTSSIRREIMDDDTRGQAHLALMEHKYNVRCAILRAFA